MLLPTFITFAQVDTTYIYNPATSFGALDLRISKSPSQYYYLDEGHTFSFREADGVKTNSFLDMTAWDSQPYQQGNMREKTEGSDLFVMNYRLLSPEGYREDYAQGYPLVIFFHGLHERGNCVDTKCYHASQEYLPNTNDPPAPTAKDHKLLNNDYNLVHGGSNYLEARNNAGISFPDDPSLSPQAFPGFVVFPQNLNGWDERSVEDAIRLVRLLIKKYNIDENRIYINGVSHGGHASYEALKRAPWLFAAGVLFSAVDDASIISQNLISRIANIPLWIFQGGKDAKPSPKQTENYIKQFESEGASVRYTLYPQLGHGTWNKAFNEPDFFSWMLRQKKNNIHVFAHNAVICKTTGEGARLMLPEGYSSYQWEFNGQTVDNANSATYIANHTGSYRARFATKDLNGMEVWNEWSEIVEVSEKDTPAPQVDQSGTILLRDPNGGNTVTLNSKDKYEYYYWLKDGVALNLPGGKNDSTRSAIIKPGYGDGVYQLQVSGFDKCKSPLSEPKHIFFSDRAPVNIPTPADLKAQNNTSSEITLTWEDLSGNETGFEVWRRKKTNEDQFENWQLVSLTNPNIISFTDNNVLPSSAYQFMIRAVSDSGRSDYTPLENRPTVQTTEDTEPPSAPLELTARQDGINTVELMWKPSMDNFDIMKYIINYNDDTVHTKSNDTTYILKDLQVNTLYRFQVKAIDAGNNLSDYSNVVEINTAVNGLFYQHSTGAWEDLESIDWSIAEFTGTVDDFTLAPKTQEDFFNFRFDGYLHIQTDGVYQFRISSNDGSSLSLDDTVWVENDGIHNLTTRTAPIQILSAGPHRIRVDFFDYTESDSLLVEYKGPDSNDEWIKIPSEALRSTLITSLEKETRNILFNVFPNPTSHNNINISFQRPTKEAVTITLLDNIGRIIYQEEKLAREERFSLDLSEKLSEGIYLLRIKLGDTLHTQRLVITD